MARRTARTASSLLLAVVVATSGLALPGPASADEVSTAQQRVERLQSLVQATVDKLTRGTREWEQDQASLRRVQAALKVTQQRIVATQLVVDRTTEHVNALARRMYMHPVVAGDLQMVLTSTPEGILSALRTQDAVEHVAGTDGERIRDAQHAKLELRREQQRVEQQTAQAQVIEKRSASKLVELRALATETASLLRGAESSLAGARSRAAVAAAARARAARLRALAAQRASPGCAVKSTAGRANGNLDPASLCALWMAPGHMLRYDAAAAFNRMSKLHQATAGRPLCVTDSYRSYSEQVDVYNRKPQLAAIPGTSNHGWGIALDMCGGVQSFGTPGYAWMKANGPRFGWIHPSWAEPSGSKPEAWHWEFVG